MKKLLNRLIQPLIGKSRKSANRAYPSGDRHSTFTLTTVVLVCLALLPKAYAGSPSPQSFAGENLGGGNSAAENVKALISLTTGVDNTATGFQALLSNTAGSNNTATGFQSLLNNTTGGWNIANGDQALASNSTGSFNTALGSQALLSNTTGSDNTATGRLALSANTTGYSCTAFGSGALFSNTSAYANTATGFHALFTNTTGGENTAVGWNALSSNTLNHDNTAVGFNALAANNTGGYNSAFGASALWHNTSGSRNTGIGRYALASNTTGWYNTASGYSAMYNNTVGSYNTAIGYEILLHNIQGAYNTVLGYHALNNNVSGNDNVAIGDSAGYNQSTGSNNIYIGAGMVGGADENNTCYIGNIWNQTASGGTTVVINNAGKLGTLTSPRRFKDDIKPMNEASETLFPLKPVTFRYKKEIDPQGIPQFGLIAEDVAEVNPQLVVRDKEGKVNTVRYEQINAMLLNEFLKEHKTVKDQQTTIRQLKSEAANQEQTISAIKKEMGVLTAQVKEQAAQIQKVGTQIETRRSAARLVTNH